MCKWLADCWFLSFFLSRGVCIALWRFALGRRSFFGVVVAPAVLLPSFLSWQTVKVRLAWSDSLSFVFCRLPHLFSNPSSKGGVSFGCIIFFLFS